MMPMRDKMTVEALLSPRMKMVASLVPKSDTVCDIGTDHGYVPIFLVKNSIAEKVIAADIKKGPLRQAQKNIEAFLLDTKIEPRLSDGFENIRPCECETAVIAGMGGETIAAILEKDIGIKSFVLQPQSAHRELRTYLQNNGYIITQEKLCREGRKMYVAMLAVRGKSAQMTRAELEIGPILIKMHHPLLGDYINYRLHEINRVLDKLADAPSAVEKKKEFEYLKEKYTEIASNFYEAYGDNKLS